MGGASAEAPSSAEPRLTQTDTIAAGSQPQSQGADLAPVPIDMSVNVLTQGYWPSYPAITVRLPEQLHRQQELFSRFYLSKHSGRKLLFQPTLGHCTLRAQFAPVRSARLSSTFYSTLI